MQSNVCSQLSTKKQVWKDALKIYSNDAEMNYCAGQKEKRGVSH